MGKVGKMATAIRESLEGEVSADEHEVLLQQASQTFRVLQRLMKHVKHALLADVPHEMARMGEGQYRALHLLSDEGRLTAGDLAGRCNVADPTMSKVVKSLESVGLVERQTDKWLSILRAALRACYGPSATRNSKILSLPSTIWKV
jgi:hypothetical protein